MNETTTMLYNKHMNTLLQPKLVIELCSKQTQIYKEIKALTFRLYIQLSRQPLQITAGIIQPLLWLILFGALFKNAPINLLEKYDTQYKFFLSSGMIIFTAFNGAINGGLPIIFDREFGFFNRIIISPIKNQNSLRWALILYTWTLSIIQIITIIIFNVISTKILLKYNDILSIISISTLIIFNIANISICLGFILPGHIEFLAFTLIINLPTLFSSTALAPLSFMPQWLQIIACTNPLTYAIEIIRNLNSNDNNKIIETIWFRFNINQSVLILIAMNIIALVIIQKILQYKYD